MTAVEKIPTSNFHLGNNSKVHTTEKPVLGEDKARYYTKQPGGLPHTGELCVWLYETNSSRCRRELGDLAVVLLQ